jgi:surfactin synthase thioesterase subunit
MVALSLPNAYSYDVAPLVLYGHSFGLGLAFRRQMHTVSQIILFISLIQLAVSVPDGLSCSLSSLLVFGWCGMRKTFEYSEIQ